MPESSPRPDLRNPVQLLAFGFGSGCAPKAPGTAGSLVAIPLYYLLLLLPGPGYLLATLALTIGGTWVCGRASAQLGVHDHPGIVLDEIAGMLITLWMAPQGLAWVLLGFGLFRFFDILKPWPIRWLDRQVAGGLGIMLDDVLAGVFAWVCLQAANQILRFV